MSGHDDPRGGRPDPGALLDELAQVLYAYDTEPELDKERHRRQALGVLSEWIPEALPDLLLGVAEVAERLGVRKNTVQVWRQRHDDFPAPIVVLAGGPVWWAPDVDAWYANRPHLSAGDSENGA